MEGKHRHDETRRAEAALGGVGVDHRLLHGMQRAVGCRQTLDGQDRTPSICGSIIRQELTAW